MIHSYAHYILKCCYYVIVTTIITWLLWVVLNMPQQNDDKIISIVHGFVIKLFILSIIIYLISWQKIKICITDVLIARLYSFSNFVTIFLSAIIVSKKRNPPLINSYQWRIIRN